MMDDLKLWLAGIINLIQGRPRLRSERRVHYAHLGGGRQIRTEYLAIGDHEKVLNVEFVS